MYYDAIVIGSGISGGWAAKELCEKGLKTLLLERGRDVKHVTDYTTAMLNPWDFPNRLQQTQRDREENPVQCNFYNEGSKAFLLRTGSTRIYRKNRFYGRRETRWEAGRWYGGGNAIAGVILILKPIPGKASG